ncbi:MAG: hypothetical protein KC445_07295, partial [Anaerolineales bacterium]|nr:hypothetical protein [Anaerolineales bacterium]
ANVRSSSACSAGSAAKAAVISGGCVLRHLVWRVHEEVGDGSATTAVLAQALLHESTKMVAAGANVMRVLAGMRQAVQIALDALDEMAEPVAGQEELAAVATAVTTEPDLSWVIGEMYHLLGVDAYITIENFVAPYLERVYLEGGFWPGNLVSPYLITAHGSQRAVQSDCAVLLYDGHLQSTDGLANVLQLIAGQENPNLLFVAHQMNAEAVTYLVAAHSHPKNKLKIVATALGVGGESGRQELDDLALLTGAEILGGVAGRPLATITREDLGSAKRVEADKNGLHVIGGGGDKRAIRDEIEALQIQLNDLDARAEEREALQKRLARFSGSSGVLKIGARTKAERQVLRRKAEQGLKAVAATLEGGVLPGGGIAYVLAAEKIDPTAATEIEVQMGMRAVKNALSAPFYRICENGKKPAPAVALQQVLAAGDGYVFDILHDRIEPAQEAGVMDAAKVLSRVLETAASGAEMALSVDVTILKKTPRTNLGYEP